jgi:hypothetical protein
MTTAERALFRYKKQNTGFLAHASSQLERMDRAKQQDALTPKYRVVPMAEAKARIKARLGL